MEIKFELTKSTFEGVEYYGRLILSSKSDEIKVNITVRKNKDNKELFVCYPTKKNVKEDRYYNEVSFSDDLYKEINKVLNKKY